MVASVLVAVVDDDASAREAIAGLLRALGHEALEFTCAADVLAAAELSRLDWLIADMRMPETTGLDLHRRLVATGATIPVVLVSAYPHEDLPAQALAAGVRAFLAKPIEAATLIELLSAPA